MPRRSHSGGVASESTLGFFISGTCCSGVPGAWSSDPSSPTGDGEATSHSGPLEHQSLFVPCGGPQINVEPLLIPSSHIPSEAFPYVPRVLFLASPRGIFFMDEPGDGEHLSLPLPVGRPHCGLAGPPYWPSQRRNQGRDCFGGLSAACACCSRMCSSLICWAWVSMTWCWSVILASSVSINFAFVSVSPVFFPGRKTRHSLPTFAPAMFPFFNLRLTVSVLIPMCCAAWAMPMPLFCTVATSVVSILGRILGVRLGSCLCMFLQTSCTLYMALNYRSVSLAVPGE